MWSVCSARGCLSVVVEFGFGWLCHEDARRWTFSEFTPLFFFTTVTLTAGSVGCDKIGDAGTPFVETRDGTDGMSNASNCSALLLSRLPIPGATFATGHAVRQPHPTPSLPSTSLTSLRKQEPKQHQWLTLLRRLPDLSGEGSMIGESVSGACFEPVNPQNACPTPWSELRDTHVPHPHTYPMANLGRVHQIRHLYLPVCYDTGCTGKPDGTWHP